MDRLNLHCLKLDKYKINFREKVICSVKHQFLKQKILYKVSNDILLQAKIFSHHYYSLPNINGEGFYNSLIKITNKDVCTFSLTFNILQSNVTCIFNYLEIEPYTLDMNYDDDVEFLNTLIFEKMKKYDIGIVPIGLEKHQAVCFSKFNKIKDRVDLYFFDPCGSGSNSHKKSRELEKYLPKMKNVNFIFGWQGENNIGIQTICRKLDKGYCIMFSLFWSYCAINYSNNLEDVEKLIIEKYKNATELYDIILAFSNLFLQQYTNKNYYKNKNQIIHCEKEQYHYIKVFEISNLKPINFFEIEKYEHDFLFQKLKLFSDSDNFHLQKLEMEMIKNNYIIQYKIKYHQGMVKAILQDDPKFKKIYNKYEHNFRESYIIFNIGLKYENNVKLIKTAKINLTNRNNLSLYEKDKLEEYENENYKHSKRYII